MDKSALAFVLCWGKLSYLEQVLLSPCFVISKPALVNILPSHLNASLLNDTSPCSVFFMGLITLTSGSQILQTFPRSLVHSTAQLYHFQWHRSILGESAFILSPQRCQLWLLPLLPPRRTPTDLPACCAVFRDH